MNQMEQESDAGEFDPSQASGQAETPDVLLPGADDDMFVPKFPERLEDLDVNPTFLADLALKAVSMESSCTTASISTRLHLGLVGTDGLLKRLYDEKYIEKKGVVGLHNHQYAMLDRGWKYVQQLHEMCGYVGPAPVSLPSYGEMIVSQVRSRRTVTQHALNQAMSSLVLSEQVRETLGLVATSGRSLFLSGPPGNGKTAMARALANTLTASLWIPYAIEVDGHVIRVFDSHTHEKLPTGTLTFDRRWVKIRVPLVVAGGEMTLDDLDLRSAESNRFYEAPFQLKSNGGVLLIDDLGRQRCSARQLLNRWIIPLENRIDYLMLSTGKKFQVPFEQLVVFATNLNEPDLADEAFLRRMGYRLYVGAPDLETYDCIFRAFAKSYGLGVEPHTIARLMERYELEHRVPKACEPRDLILRSLDLCKFRRQQPVLNDSVLDAAWFSYFGDTAMSGRFDKAKKTK